MAWFPGAIRKPIARHDTAIIGPRRYTLHTAVSSGSSLFNYFNQPGNPTSHFYVRADGTVEQYVSTAYRAPAQLEGNHDTISVETQDMGGPFPSWSGSNVPAWMPQQLEALAQIGAWLHTTHGIKLQFCPNSLPRTEGFAYHRQGIDPWRVDGGERWSSAYGKVCPGDRRIKQVPYVLARAQAIVTREDDMPTADEVADAVWRRLRTSPLDPDTKYSTLTYLAYAWRDGKWLLQGQAKMGAELAAIKTALQQLLSKPGEPIDMAAIEAAALKGAQEAMAELDVTIRVTPDTDAPA